MDDFRRFLEESPIAAELRLSTRLILRRSSIGSGAIGDMAESGSYFPMGGAVCELEVGNLCIARGRIVRRMGKSYFKITEMGEGGTQ
jgi:hypothetical protein